MWGKVITYLRSKHNIALHIACGEIVDTEIKDGCFFIKTQEEYLYSIINSKENMSEIQNAIKWQGLNFDVKVVLIEKESDKQREDINFLKEKLGKYFKVI